MEKIWRSQTLPLPFAPGRHVQTNFFLLSFSFFDLCAKGDDRAHRRPSDRDRAESQRHRKDFFFLFFFPRRGTSGGSGAARWRTAAWIRPTRIARRRLQTRPFFLSHTHGPILHRFSFLFLSKSLDGCRATKGKPVASLWAKGRGAPRPRPERPHTEAKGKASEKKKQGRDHRQSIRSSTRSSRSATLSTPASRMRAIGLTGTAGSDGATGR